MGINDFDFLIYLENGQSIETPHMVIGYTDKGLESMSHNMMDCGYDLIYLFYFQNIFSHNLLFE